MEDYVGPATGRALALCRLDEQIKAIQPTNRGDSSDKSGRFIRQIRAVHPANQSGSVNKKKKHTLFIR
jgi:hypothetical protein